MSRPASRTRTDASATRRPLPPRDAPLSLLVRSCLATRHGTSTAGPVLHGNRKPSALATTRLLPGLVRTASFRCINSSTRSRTAPANIRTMTTESKRRHRKALKHRRAQKLSILRPQDAHQRVRWWKVAFTPPSELWRHTIRDPGCITAAVLVLSSAIYCTTSFIANHTTYETGKVAWWIRGIQVVAGAGFVVSCSFSAWSCRPWFGCHAWYAEVFHALGSVGFLSSSALGLAQGREVVLQHHLVGCWLAGKSRLRRQTRVSLTARVGVAFFCAGSAIECVLALRKFPIEKVAKPSAEQVSGLRIR